MLSSRSRGLLGLALGLGLLILLLALRAHYLAASRGDAPTLRHAPWRPADPAALARWPWPHTETDHPHRGVKHWIDRSSPDGTVVELFDFDFHRNPHLRLELFDQDEDDQAPFDDHADFWTRGVGQVTRHLNETGRGRVIAAWNGLFYNPTSGSLGSHVAPVVLAGKAYYNVGVIRWAVGVKYRKRRPVLKVIRLPDFRTLGSEFDYAAEGASCLIHEGRPLRLRPFPKPNEDPFPLSTPPAAGEAGFVRAVDHIRTSRTSMAWSKDNRHLYLLIVKEPDSEAPSKQAFRRHLQSMGGWTVADLQRFWHAFGVWCAVNVDGGDATQLAALRSDGRYDLVPSRAVSGSMRLICLPSFDGAPAGHSMMFFYVRD